jgi:hypothetical protein
LRKIIKEAAVDSKFYIVSILDDKGRRVPVYEGFELETAAEAHERHTKKRITDAGEGVVFQQTWKEKLQEAS